MRKWIVVGTVLLVGALALGWVAWAQEVRTGERHATTMLSGGFGGHGKWGRTDRRSERLLALLDNDHVRESLGLTDAETGRLREIIVNTEKASVKSGAEMAVRGIELRELLRADKPDREAVMKNVGEISALRAQMMKAHINALLEAKTVLTPEQQKKIRAFMESEAGREGRRDVFSHRRVPDGPGEPPKSATPPQPPATRPQP